MRRWWCVTMAIATIALVSAVGADAQDRRFMARPFVFIGAADACGVGTAAGEDTVDARWVTHEGLRDAGRSDHALFLQKLGPGSNCAWAGARIRKVTGITLTELGYDVRDDGHCGTGAPRFEVVMSDDGLHTLGCAAGPVVDSLVDSRGDTWTRKRWTASDLADAAFAAPPITGASGTVVSISIVFDEGEDAGPDFTGEAFLDNIDVNGVLMGKPGLGKAPKP